MKTTGYGLREAIKAQTLKRDTAADAFNGSLKKFPNEDKETPQTIVDTFTKAERALVHLQVAQMRYNLAVTVEAGGVKMTLAEAIKSIGGAGRIEKMWKGSIGDTKRNPYGVDSEDTRNVDEKIVRATRTVSAQDAVKLTTASGKRASTLRAAIAIANGKEVEIENLDSSLFE